MPSQTHALTNACINVQYMQTINYVRIIKFNIFLIANRKDKHLFDHLLTLNPTQRLIYIYIPKIQPESSHYEVSSGSIYIIPACEVQSRTIMTRSSIETEARVAYMADVNVTLTLGSCVTNRCLQLMSQTKLITYTVTHLL